MKYLLACLALVTSACSTTTEPKVPLLKVDYVGPGTFRWGTHEGYSLLSFTQNTVMPRIASDGTFYLDNFQLPPEKLPLIEQVSNRKCSPSGGGPAGSSSP